jgi:hypothetical protein
MKKLLFLAAVSFLGVFIFVSSCTKEESSQVLTFGNTEVPVENGRLVFKDDEHFKLVYEYLVQNLDKTHLQNWGDFVSAEKAYLQTNEVYQNATKDVKINTNVAYWHEDGNGEKTLKSIIGHPIYALLCNSKRVLQIGDKILQHDLEEAHFYDAQYFGQAGAGTIPGRTTVKLPTTNLDKSCESPSTCRSVYATRNGKQWKKLEAEVKFEYYLVSINPSVYLLTGRFIYENKSYKRAFLGSWASNVADEMRITWDGGTPVTVPNSSSMSRIGNACSSDHEIEDTNEDNINIIDPGSCSM